MPVLEWHPALEVGHGQIDAQHRTLVEALNRLSATVAQGVGRAEVEATLTFLRDYTVSHFKTEEALMIRHGYPGAPAHFTAHADLVLQVSDFLADFRSGKEVSAGDMSAFLERWLLEHILGSDKALGAYLRNRGLSS